MSAPSAWLAGLRLRCPQCGEGKLFQSYLQFADKCPVCGANFAAADAGDGPVVFVILVVGAIVVPVLMVLQYGFHAPVWVAAAITMIMAIALCLAFLPPFKAILFALQWKHKASEVHFDVDGSQR